MSFSLPFWKYQCTGNDFILVESHEESSLILDTTFSNWVSTICKRRFGAGADGLILLQRGKNGLSIHFFNADGTPASCCGNALLCASKHLEKQKVSVFLQNREYLLEDFGDGWHAAFLDLPQKNPEKISHSFGDLYLIDTGVLHAVVFSDEITKETAKTLRESLDANINLVTKKQDKWFVETFEKGVEDFTYGCATGAAAVALTCKFLYNEENYPFTILSKGGLLQVSIQKKNEQWKIQILGSPELLYKGFGERYENWNTQGSQRSRIPSGTHS